MNQANPYSNIILGIIGSPDFCRRMTAIMVASKLGVRTCSGSLAEAWSVVLTNRPNSVVVEVGMQHSERQHAALRDFLAQLRERYKDEIYTIVAITSPQKLFYGGDLLFQDEESLTPSTFVDTFVVLPPGSIPSVPGLHEQMVNVMSLYHHELQRRAEGKIPLPPLGSEGWVQSLADPKSRELWMKWLPRYASYTNENPLIIGKTGTGKTNLAFALHKLSGRPGKFIAITPRDFSSSELVQAELFGAVAGAYTGAVDKWGLVKSAEKGTLFIDELQSIDKDLQGKLITFIENKIYRRVGSSESITADVRFVFASNRALYDMMENEVLRDDFAYRLERVQLELLPLNMRRLDVSAALAYSLAKIHRQRPQAVQVFGFTSEAYRMIFGHKWPGNLRQLENTTAQLCELCDMNGISTVDEQAALSVFDTKLFGTAATTAEIVVQAAERLSRQELQGSIDSVSDGVQKFVEMMRVSALEASGGDRGKAAELIGDDATLMELAAQAILTRTSIGLIK